MVYLIYYTVYFILVPVLSIFFDLSDKEMVKEIIPIINYASMTLAIYFLARCSLVFPATAIDRSVGLKWSWRLSAGNGWRLVIIAGALPWVLATFILAFQRDIASFWELVALAFVSYLLGIFEIAGLSLAFKELSNKEDVNQSEMKPNPSD